MEHPVLPRRRTGRDRIKLTPTSGTIDIVHGTGGYWSGQVDIGNIDIGLPGAWTSVEEAKAIFDSAEVVDVMNEAYTEAGAVFLMKGYGHDYDLLTKEPVTSLSDLQFRKIRATSAVAKVLDKFSIPTGVPARPRALHRHVHRRDRRRDLGGLVEYEQPAE